MDHDSSKSTMSNMMEVDFHDNEPKLDNRIEKDGNEEETVQVVPPSGDWKQNLLIKTAEIQKTILAAADVAKDKFKTSFTIASEIANDNISKSINIAANKFGLLVGKNYFDFLKENGTNEATIVAGKTTSIPFFVPKNKAIAWKVMVKSYDLGLVIKVREQSDGGSIEVELEPLLKISAEELFVGGRKPVDFDRYMILQFDNSYSLLRSKVFAYQVLTGEGAIVALEQAHNTAMLHEDKSNATLLNGDLDQSDSDKKKNSLDFKSSSIATIRYVNDGIGTMVSSIVVKAQSASTAITTQAKTTAENLQNSDWKAYGLQASQWTPPYIRKFIDPLLVSKSNVSQSCDNIDSDNVEEGIRVEPANTEKTVVTSDETSVTLPTESIDEKNSNKNNISENTNLLDLDEY